MAYLFDKQESQKLEFEKKKDAVFQIDHKKSQSCRHQLVHRISLSAHKLLRSDNNFLSPHNVVGDRRHLHLTWTNHDKF